jgi:hypothetical protein
MLHLSKIKAAATVKTNQSATKQSAQLEVFNKLQTSKKLSAAKVLDMVTEYTLRPDKQRETWFKTEASYNKFVNDAEAVKTEADANKFMLANKTFINAMNKKTFDLFFNAKHKRSFYNNKAYASAVKVTTIFSGKNELDLSKSFIEIK